MRNTKQYEKACVVDTQFAILLTTSAQVNSITAALNKTLLLENHLFLLMEFGSLGISTEVRHSLLLVTTVVFCENLLLKYLKLTHNTTFKVIFDKT